MAEAGTVTIDFAAETAKFTAELKKVNDRLAGVESSFKKIEGAAKTAFAVFAAIGPVVNFSKRVFDAANELDRLNQKTGIAIASLSRLQFAASQTDTEFASLTQGVTQFQNRLSKGDATDAIHQLGLELTNIRSLKVEDQLLEISRGFALLNDPADKVRIAMELFGKAGADLIPFLSQGPEQIRQLAIESDKLGATLNEKTVAQLDRAEKAANRLKAALNGLVTGVLAGTAILLLPEEQTKQEQFNKVFERRLEIQAQLARYAQLPDPFGVNQISVRTLTAELEQNTIKMIEFQDVQRNAIIEAGKAAEAVRLAAEQRAADANKIVDLGTLSFGLTAEQKEAIENDLKQFNNDLSGLKKAFNLSSIELDNSAVLDRLRIEDEGHQQEAANADFWRKYAEDREEESQAKQLKFKQDGLNAAQALLTAYGGKYRKFAQALLIFDKAKAIANIIVETQAAATKSISTYGYPLGLAAAAGAIAFGAARIAVVASTVIGSNNMPAVGSAGNPVFTNSTDTSLNNDERPTASSQQVTQVIFQGPVYNTDDFQRSIVDALKDVSDRDVIIFSGQSAQAQTIRAA